MSDGARRASEARLDSLREEGSRLGAGGGAVAGAGVRAAGGPLPPAAGAVGYYGRPALKPPVWTWEIPLYFFVGGVAGAAGVLALAAQLGGEGELARSALWTALFGLVASAALLVSDLGRPRRFLHMLRVFKWRSPMSVGVWVLTAYGAAVGTALGLVLAGGNPAGRLLLGALAVSAALGALVATYTGVLLAATAVPAWNVHRGTLPLHFGVAALGSAAALLELLGHGAPALPLIGLASAAIETAVGARVELRRSGPRDRALREGRPGLLLRSAGVLSGPLALGLRLGGLGTAAAWAFLLGALLSRFGWVEAGRASASDPAAALARVPLSGSPPSR